MAIIHDTPYTCVYCRRILLVPKDDGKLEDLGRVKIVCERCDRSVFKKHAVFDGDRRVCCVYCSDWMQFMNVNDRRIGSLILKDKETISKSEYTTTYTPEYFQNIEEFFLNYPDIQSELNIPPITNNVAKDLPSQLLIGKLIYPSGLKPIKEYKKNLHECMNHMISIMGGINRVYHTSVYRQYQVAPIIVTCSPMRSTKFVGAIASQFTVVHYNWVINCFLKNKLVDMSEYILPSGIIENQYIIHPPSLYNHNNLVFNNITIAVIGFPIFVEQWSDILRKAGAIVDLHIWRQSNTVICNSHLSYVVVDSERKPEFFKRGKELDIPMCSTEWVIHCIVGRRLLDVNEKWFYTESSMWS
eukprot:TRINITY_DN3159_c0_g2_i1.p1 TRINITY_DN3159_c0_g2~~TRINITY_DN3159_c0_g2_i1.p1  ORF type:complete len:415 (-),score=63.64 TRINITY_DN3159_c0_g2_i1:61-1131(-)